MIFLICQGEEKIFHAPAVCIKIITAIAVCMRIMAGRPIIKRLCSVLWCIILIVRYIAAAPPARAMRKRVFSGMRIFFFFERFLSVIVRSTAARFTDKKYTAVTMKKSCSIFMGSPFLAGRAGRSVTAANSLVNYA